RCRAGEGFTWWRNLTGRLSLPASGPLSVIDAARIARARFSRYAATSDVSGLFRRLNRASYPHSRGALGQSLASPGCLGPHLPDEPGACLPRERRAASPASPQEASVRVGPSTQQPPGGLERWLGRLAVTTFIFPWPTTRAAPLPSSFSMPSSGAL